MLHEMGLGSLFVSIVFVCAASGARSSSLPPWRNWTLPIEQRIEDIVSRLTLEEKVQNLEGSAPGAPRLNLSAHSYAHECLRGDVSGKSGTGFPQAMGLAESWSTYIMLLVARASADEIRANYNTDRASNPGGSTGLSCFAPVVNLCQNPLWGRCQETYGEDPHLTSELAYSFVRWMQFNDAVSIKYPELLTIVKHFAVYAGPEGYSFTFSPQAERFGFDAVLSERRFREDFLPAYRATIEAGAVGVMASYSAITLTGNRSLSMANLPSSINRPLLYTVLREELGMDNQGGYVISDAGAVVFAYHAVGQGHDVVKSPSEAAERAIEAGLDIELTCCGAPQVFPLLVQAVKEGRVNESTVDRALSRGLREQFRLGVLDPEEAPSQQLQRFNDLTTANTVESEKHREVALRAAREGLVLLRNGGAGGTLRYRRQRLLQGSEEEGAGGSGPWGASADALPWDPNGMQGQRVCVVGPLANDSAALMGDYHPKPSRTIFTPFLGMQQRLQELGTGAEAVLAVGCSDYTYCPAVDDAAVKKAVQSCDRTVVALGLSARSMSPNTTNACGCPKGDAVEGECCDRYAVGLPGMQGHLLDVVVQAAAGAKAPHHPVLFANSAGMLDLASVLEPQSEPDTGAVDEADQGVAAVLHGAFLAEATGLALADAVLGQGAPSGRLATTWYRDIARAPGIKNYTWADRGYRSAPEDNIAVEFGFGLTGYGVGARYEDVFLYPYKVSARRSLLGEQGQFEEAPLPPALMGGKQRVARVLREEEDQRAGSRARAARSDSESPKPIDACMAVGWTLRLCTDDPEAGVREAVQVYMVGNHSAPGGVTNGRGRLVDFMKSDLSTQCAMFASQVMPEALAVLRESDFERVLEPGVRCLRFGASSSVLHGTGLVDGDVEVSMEQMAAAGAGLEACFDLQTPDGKPVPLSSCGSA